MSTEMFFCFHCDEELPVSERADGELGRWDYCKRCAANYEPPDPDSAETCARVRQEVFGQA